jgi:signal transduction histidine kinase
MTRFRLYASTWKLISVRTFRSLRINKCDAPIHAFSVPKQCSTVCLCLLGRRLFAFLTFPAFERREFHQTLDARVAERTRIARELHDTLLQSFHGLLLRFQTVSTLLPDRAAEAKAMLDSSIEQAADAITEAAMRCRRCARR